MQGPLVVCLCLTKDRLGWLQTSIDCFEVQTYENKALLIVADSARDYEGIDMRGISVLHDPGALVGEKRNSGCFAAELADLIAVWDDDDFSAAGRLANQVQTLQETRKAVTGYSAMKFTDGASWWQFSYSGGFCLGTSLCFTREWWWSHRFEEFQIGQDEKFAADAAAAGQLAEVPDLDLMYATIHPGNTSKRKPQQDSGWSALPGFLWPA